MLAKFCALLLRIHLSAAGWICALANNNTYVGNVIADDQCCCHKFEYLLLSPNHLARESLYAIQRDFSAWCVAIGINIAHGSWVQHSSVC